MLVIPKTARKEFLAALTAESGLLDGALLKLYKTPVGSSEEISLAGLTECDFTGYAASSAIEWGAVGLDSLNNAFVMGDRKEFVPSGTAVTNTVHGAYIVNGAGTKLLALLPFDEPQYATSTDSVISVVPRLQLPWDGETEE